MEKLAGRYEKLVRVTKACRRIIDLYQNPRVGITEVENEAFVSSVIKHFELFYEVLWKYLKHRLLEEYGDNIDGSKTILRTCFNHGIIDEAELSVLLAVVDQRNKTVHLYDEETAELACEEIIKDFVVLEKFVARLKK